MWNSTQSWKSTRMGKSCGSFQFYIASAVFFWLRLVIHWLVWFLSLMQLNIKLFKGCAILTARAAHSPSISAMLKWDLCPSSSSSAFFLFFFFVFFFISGSMLIYVILPPYGANTYGSGCSKRLRKCNQTTGFIVLPHTLLLFIIYNDTITMTQ